MCFYNFFFFFCQIINVLRSFLSLRTLPFAFLSFFFLFFGSSFLSSYPNVRGENAKIIAVHIRYSLYAHTDVNAISKNQYLHMQLITTFAFPIYMS
jgi:hypothetical protein